MRLIYNYILCFTILISQTNIFSQTYELKKYGVDEGLPSSTTSRVFTDSKGFLWILTDKGISRFDGKRFKNYSMSNGMPNNFIFSAGEDSHQRIWLYSPLRSFCYFDLNDNRFRKIPNTKDSMGVGFMTYIFENKDGGMTFYTNSKTVYTLDKTLNVIEKKAMNPLESINQSNYPKIEREAIIYTKKQAKDSIFELTTKQQNLPKNIISFPSSYATSITSSDSSFFYRKGLNIVSYANGITIEKNISDLIYGKEDFDIRIHNTGKPNLRMIRTLKESFVVDEKLNRLKEYDFINQFPVNTIYFDKKDNLWICTEEQGLIQVRKPIVKKTPPTIFTTMGIEHLAINSKGQLYVGNNKGEIFALINGKETPIKIPELPRLNFRAFGFDKKDNLFVGWRDQPHTIIPPYILQRYKNVKVRYNDELKQLTEKERNSGKISTLKFNSNFLEIVQFADVKSMAMTPDEKIYYVVGDDWRVATVSDTGWISKKITSLKTTKICADNENTIWVARVNGLWYYQDDKFDSLPQLKKKYPKLSTPLRNLAASQKNNIWLQFDSQDIYYLNPKTQSLSEIKEFRGDFTQNIYVDDEDRTWISTNNGVCMVEILSENPFRYRFIRINRASGLPTQDISKAKVFKDTLYIASPKGLTKMLIQDVLEGKKDSTLYQPLTISNLKINGKDTILRGSYDLSYNQNNLVVDFSCISFNNDDPLQYEYRLTQEGSNDTTWRKSDDASIDFSYLPFGKYRLEIKALYDNEVVSILEEPLFFNIKQAFWKTPWFIFTLLGGLGLAVWFVYKNNIDRLKKQEAERIDVLKRFNNLELQALQAQMNPHFVFNALTAIQNFIWNRDAKAANEYLTGFSTLMRLFLESSRRKYLSIDEEVTLLKHYVHLEQLRFPDKFDVVFKVSEDIKLQDEIPSMLIQPFVENAINHGLLYKEGKGLLQISFFKEGNKLLCIIEDNGVGRKAAAEKRQTSLKPHTSRATEITQERIDLLKSMEGMDISVDIEDKGVENNNNFGTKIIITIVELRNNI
jgi:ligand-binding sensor domain-containing protein